MRKLSHLLALLALVISSVAFGDDPKKTEQPAQISQGEVQGQIRPVTALDPKKELVTADGVRKVGQLNAFLIRGVRALAAQDLSNAKVAKRVETSLRDLDNGALQETRVLIRWDESLKKSDNADVQNFLAVGVAGVGKADYAMPLFVLSVFQYLEESISLHQKISERKVDALKDAQKKLKQTFPAYFDAKVTVNGEEQSLVTYYNGAGHDSFLPRETSWVTEKRIANNDIINGSDEVYFEEIGQLPGSFNQETEAAMVNSIIDDHLNVMTFASEEERQDTLRSELATRVHFLTGLARKGFREYPTDYNAALESVYATVKARADELGADTVTQVTRQVFALLRISNKDFGVPSALLNSDDYRAYEESLGK